jgi:hypothetical protein
MHCANILLKHKCSRIIVSSLRTLTHVSKGNIKHTVISTCFSKSALQQDECSPSVTPVRWIQSMCLVSDVFTAFGKLPVPAIHMIHDKVSSPNCALSLYRIWVISACFIINLMTQCYVKKCGQFIYRTPKQSFALLMLTTFGKKKLKSRLTFNQPHTWLFGVKLKQCGPMWCQ